MELPDYYCLSLRVALKASLLGKRGKSTIYACFQEMKEIWNRMTPLEIEEIKPRVRKNVQHFMEVQEILGRPAVDNRVVKEILSITK